MTRLTLVAVVLFAAPLPAQIVADFEGPDALQQWRSDAESTLSLGPGHHDHGATLHYRLACCNASASALWTPPGSFPKVHDPAVSLWIRFPPEVDVSIVAKDTNGRAAQFPIPAAAIEHPKAGEWQFVALPLPGIKNRVAELGIQVQARVRSDVAGAVSFDEVRIHGSADTFYTDSAAAVTPPSPESSELGSRLGVNIHLLRDDPALDLARAAGFAFVRMDLLWANVERGGRYRFFQYDALVRSLDARNMGVLWILDYGHPDHGGRTPRTAEDVSAFGRFAEASAAHFKGRNVRYEVWNEPNTSQFWPPSPNASEYAALLREAIAAIHRGDPAARISSGGLSRMDGMFLSRAVNPGLAAGLAAVGIHPYPKAGPETIVPELAILLEWTSRALGTNLEVWDTEWGYSSSNAPVEAPSNGHTEAGRRRQASLAVRELLTVWTLGLPLAVWYDLRDDGTDPANPEHNYGLLDANGKEKPAIEAIRILMNAVTGRKYAGMIEETPAGIHGMRFDGPKDSILVLWSEQPGNRRPVEFPKQDLVSATDCLDHPVKTKNRSNGRAQAELDESAGPIYLRWTTGSLGSRLGMRPRLPSRARQ